MQADVTDMKMPFLSSPFSNSVCSIYLFRVRGLVSCLYCNPKVGTDKDADLSHQPSVIITTYNKAEIGCGEVKPSHTAAH